MFAEQDEEEYTYEDMAQAQSDLQLLQEHVSTIETALCSLQDGIQGESQSCLLMCLAGMIAKAS